MTQEKIMLVDNELEIIQLLRLYLTREGFTVVWTTDSTQALELARNENPDLVILDVVMPGLSGFDVCNQMRELCDVPILFLSCKSSDTDKILGLTIGGDDYISKPFSPTEVVARVKAQLRRRSINSPQGSSLDSGSNICLRDIEIDTSAHSVTVSGTEVHLTAKEFELLVLLTSYPNRVFTSKQIFDQLWESYGIEEDYRTVMVHISNLRKKIEPNPDKPAYIQTVRGVGYKII